MPSHQNGSLVQEAGTGYQYTHISNKLSEVLKWICSAQTLWQRYPNQLDLKLCFSPFGLTPQEFIPTHIAGFYHHKWVKFCVSSCLTFSLQLQFCVCLHTSVLGTDSSDGSKGHAMVWGTCRTSLPAAFTTSVKPSQGLLARKEQLLGNKLASAFKIELGLLRYS